MVWGSKTASILFKSISFDEKVNLVSTFGRKVLKFSKVFKTIGKNNIKMKEKREFLRNIGF